MSGVFDRLQKQINDKTKEGGITALDLVDLPPSLRKIMRLMLRRLQMNHAQLQEAMKNMPEKDRISERELTQALSTLTEQYWLIRLGEGERATYKVNLRRKAGSTLEGDIWASLNKRIEPGE